MVCLTRCCLCIPLEPACYIIGLYYIVNHIIWLIQYVEEYRRFQERDRTFENNHYLILISRMVFAAMGILLGTLIFLFTCKRFVLGLKLCGCAIGLSAMIEFIAQLMTPALGKPILLYFLYLLVFFYLAIVVYSYGMYLEEGPVEDLLFYSIALQQLRNPNRGQPQQQYDNPYSGDPQQQPQPGLSPQTPQSETVQKPWIGY